MNSQSQPTFLISAPCCSSSCRENSHHAHHKYSEEGCVFQIKWAINPHMKIGASSATKALTQHAHFTTVLREAGAELITMPFVHGAYDSVFIKDNAILKRHSGGMSALIANPFYDERKVESERRRFSLRSRGVEIAGQTRKSLEGGDIVVHRSKDKILMGHGFRTHKESSAELSHFMDMEVIPLQLCDPSFYHLDVATAVLNDGTTFACREAFTDNSWNTLKHEVGAGSLIEVSRADTMNFGLNWVEVGDTVVMGSYVPRLAAILSALGKKVHYAPLDQFQLAGGSAACLVARVHGTIAPAKLEIPTLQVKKRVVENNSASWATN